MFMLGDDVLAALRVMTWHVEETLLDLFVLQDVVVVEADHLLCVNL